MKNLEAEEFGGSNLLKQNDTLLAQLAEAQAEVNKWTRMASCAGFDKTGLLAVGEELQKRDQQLADQRAENERYHDLVRHQRSELHEAGLLTDAEYAAFMGDGGKSVDRLQSYDAQRAAMQGMVEALTEMLRLTSRGMPWYDQMPAARAQANAALAAAEKLTQPQEQLLVLDLYKAERIGEQIRRDSPVINGPAEVEP